MNFSKCDGIYFIEGTPEKYVFVDAVSTETDAFFRKRKIKDLDEIKECMALSAQNANANAVIKFRYSIKKTFFQTIFGLPGSYYQASGIIANINPKEFEGETTES